MRRIFCRVSSMSLIVIQSSTGQTFTYAGNSTSTHPFIDFPSLANIVSITVPNGFAVFVTDYADIRAMQVSAGTLTLTPTVAPSSQLLLVIVKIGAQLTLQATGSSGNPTLTTAFWAPSDVIGRIDFTAWLIPQSYVLGLQWNGTDFLSVTNIAAIVSPNILSLVLSNSTISTLTSANTGTTNLGTIKAMFFTADTYINNMYIFPGGDAWPVVTTTPMQSGRTEIAQTTTS